jgi:hypothetical protein
MSTRYRLILQGDDMFEAAALLEREGFEVIEARAVENEPTRGACPHCGATPLLQPDGSVGVHQDLTSTSEGTCFGSGKAPSYLAHPQPPESEQPNG